MANKPIWKLVYFDINFDRHSADVPAESLDEALAVLAERGIVVGRSELADFYPPEPEVDNGRP